MRVAMPGMALRRGLGARARCRGTPGGGRRCLGLRGGRRRGGAMRVAAMPHPLPTTAPRRSQEERREETRRRLLEATLRLLLQNGYTRLTTPDIARAAGVSRGALTHHFANKEDIVVRALAHQLDAVTEGLRRFCETRPAPTMNVEEVVDCLWAMMSDGLFYTTLEYLPEARHNEGFRQRLLPVVRDFHAALDSIWTRLAESYGVPAEAVRIALNTTMCLIRGMIAQTVLRDDDAYFRAMLAYWKGHLRADLEGPRRACRRRLGKGGRRQQGSGGGQQGSSQHGGASRQEWLASDVLPCRTNGDAPPRWQGAGGRPPARLRQIRPSWRSCRSTCCGAAAPIQGIAGRPGGTP